MAGSRVDEDITPRIGRDARRLSQLDVVWKLQRITGRIEWNIWRRRLRHGRDPEETSRRQQERQEASHFVAPFAAACGFSVIFCTRHDSISATMSSFGFR